MKLRRTTITASEHTHRGIEILYTDRYEADVKDKHFEALEFEEIVRLIDTELDSSPAVSLPGHYYWGSVTRYGQPYTTIPEQDKLYVPGISVAQAHSQLKELLKRRYGATRQIFDVDVSRIVKASMDAPKWTRSRLSNEFRIQYANDPCVGLSAQELQAVMDPFYNNIDGLRDKIVDCLCEAVPNIFTADEVRLDIDPRIDVPDYQFIIDDMVVFVDIDTNGEPFVTEW